MLQVSPPVVGLERIPVPLPSVLGDRSMCIVRRVVAAHWTPWVLWLKRLAPSAISNTIERSELYEGYTCDFKDSGGLLAVRLRDGEREEI